MARQLNDAGLGTLLFDLLTVEEARDRANVFDVELLADRLRAVARWVRRQAGCEGLGVGYFGASTGAAVVRGATHLFEEPGTLETVAHLACDWFLRFLRGDD